MQNRFDSSSLHDPVRSGVKIALLVFLTLAVFSPLLIGGHFFWDDYLLLVDNPLIKSRTGLFGIWFSARNPDYFPLTSTLFWVEWRLWGGAQFPQGYHLVNVLLHIGSSLLLWRIFRRLRVPGAFLIALLFAVHPVNVESAAWIAEGKNTLSMFWLCAALLVYLHFERRGRLSLYLAALACFLLALLAKTSVVMFPFVLLLLAWRRRRRIAPAAMLRALPFFSLSLILGLVTLRFQYHNAIADIVVRDDSFLSRLATAGCAVWFYLAKALVPAGIAFNYPRWDVLAHGAIAFLPLLLLLALFVTLFLLRRHGWGRQGLVALGVYVVMLLPMLGFLNVFFMRYALVSDHWQYHAIPAVLALAVGVAAVLVRRLPIGVTYTAAALVVALFAGDSFSIAAVYRTPESLWLDTLRHNPNAWLADAHLGELYLDRYRDPATHDPADLPRAISYLARVVELQPGQSLAYTNLGNALVIAGQPNDALAAYARGLAAPDAGADERSLLHYNLGALYAKAGNYPLAESHIEEALRLNPYRSVTYVPSLLRLVQIEQKQNHPARALSILKEILAADPGNADARALLIAARGASSRPG